MDDIRTEVVSDKYTDEENSDAFSEFQGSILWPKRSLLYRVSFLALLPLFAIFLLGFSSPFWMKKHQVDKYRGYYNIREKVDVSIGLWRVCEGADFSDITDCTSIPDITPYEMACQALLCLCFIFTVFSLIFGLYENCATRYDIDDGNEAKSKRPEMNAITAGIFGLIGVGMYGRIIIQVARNGEGAVHWAFPVTAASVTGVIVCGILMAIANPMHTTTPSYPGQIMSLSRQNSARIREPSIQDRLVGANDVVVQVPGAQAAGTVYGVTGNGFDAKEAPFLQRSESCLSSHMSSPDIYTAASQEQGLPHGHRSTHVVETHDIHTTRTYDPAKRSALKKQLQEKTAQRRSWHFDDRNTAYLVTELINNRSGPSLPSETRSPREGEGIKPPVPPRRDKITSPVNPNRPSMNQTLQAIPDETADLMMLDDPVVIAPSKAEQNQNAVAKAEDQPKVKRNTNPFVDDTSVPELPTTQNFAELQRSTASSGSWENQPWPDPPKECEILAQTAPAVPKNSSSTSDRSASNTPVSQLNSVPESLQYQPQNSYASLSRRQNHEAEPKASYSNSEHSGSKSSNGSHAKSGRTNPADRSHKLNRKGASGKPPSPTEGHVPIMKEYDNPLFKSQPADESRPGAFEEDFSLQICQSTSFVHPSPTRPAPPPYYSVMQNDPPTYRRHSGHQPYSPITEDSDGLQQSSRHFPQDGARDAPAVYVHHGKPSEDETPKKHSTSKEKSRASKQQQHQHQNGGVKSRLPRQVKREHHQRRSGHPEAGSGQQQQQQQQQQSQQPPSPHGGRYGSSPNLASKSPRQGRRRPDSAGAGEGVEYGSGDHYRNSRAKTPQQYSSNTYGYDRNRQSPYYNTASGQQYRHWGDSDL